jgi:hypothetical protein
LPGGFKYTTTMATRKAKPHLDHSEMYPTRRGLIKTKIKQCHDNTSPRDQTVKSKTIMTRLLYKFVF